MKKAREIQRNQKTNRLSLLDMETEQSKNAPSIASPAAVGYGPALTMPTLMGMMPDMPNLDQSGDGQKLDTSLISAPGFSPDGRHSGNVRQSVALDTSHFDSGQMPTSIANIFQGAEEGRGSVQPQKVKGCMFFFHKYCIVSSLSVLVYKKLFSPDFSTTPCETKAKRYYIC